MYAVSKVKILAVVGWLFVGVVTMPAHAADPNAAQLEQMQSLMKVMQGYYQLIEEIHEVAQDADKSAILQLQKIEEIYKQRGDRAEAIKYMRDVLKRTTSPVVRNAASVMLADALNETGRSSQAVEVLQEALENNMK